MIASDRQSAFDIVLAAVPHKGQVLTQTANFWFEETAEICVNHIIDMPDPNVVIGKRLDMFSVEIVVRDYMTGSTETSIWPMYQRGERVMYGITFPEGLKRTSCPIRSDPHHQGHSENTTKRPPRRRLSKPDA